MDKREEAKQEARKILDGFAKSLEKVKVNSKNRAATAAAFREERNGMSNNETFRKSMFENARERDGDFILAEKKEWQ